MPKGMAYKKTIIIIICLWLDGMMMMMMVMLFVDAFSTSMSPAACILQANQACTELTVSNNG
jgi:hypothetical protein